MNIVRRQPLWIIATVILTASYLAIFQIPNLWRALLWAWRGITGGSASVIITGLIEFALRLLGIGIWILSVYLCVRLLSYTKKKAYAFLLAYLLMTTITAPLIYAGQKIAYVRWQRQLHTMPQEQKEQFINHPVRKPTVATVHRSLSLPVGPTLLLLAILYLSKAEGIK